MRCYALLIGIDTAPPLARLPLCAMMSWPLVMKGGDGIALAHLPAPATQNTPQAKRVPQSRINDAANETKTSDWIKPEAYFSPSNPAPNRI